MRTRRREESLRPFRLAPVSESQARSQTATPPWHALNNHWGPTRLPHPAQPGPPPQEVVLNVAMGLAPGKLTPVVQSPESESADDEAAGPSPEVLNEALTTAAVTPLGPGPPGHVKVQSPEPESPADKAAAGPSPEVLYEALATAALTPLGPGPPGRAHVVRGKCGLVPVAGR